MRFAPVVVAVLAALCGASSARPQAADTTPPMTTIDEMGALERGAELARGAASALDPSKAQPTSVEIRITAIGSTRLRCCSTYLYDMPSAVAAEAFARGVAKHGLWVSEDGIRYLIPTSRLYQVTLRPM